MTFRHLGGRTDLYAVLLRSVYPTASKAVVLDSHFYGKIEVVLRNCLSSLYHKKNTMDYCPMAWSAMQNWANCSRKSEKRFIPPFESFACSLKIADYN